MATTKRLYGQNTTQHIGNPVSSQERVQKVQYLAPNGGKRLQIPVGFAEEDFVSGSTSKRRGAGGRASIQKYSTAFMSAMDRKYADTTKVGLKRRYNRIGRDMEHLYKNGQISTLSPNKMTKEDIHNFLAYRIGLGVSNSEIIHEIAALSNLFEYIGSKAVKDSLISYPYLRPTEVYVRGESIDAKVCKQIYDAAMLVDSSDWKRMIAYAVVVFALATGMRSKELRLCEISDIDASGPDWVAHVQHPKGEGKWGQPRTVAIDPNSYEFLKRYFFKRAEYLDEHDSVDTALFPGGHAEVNGALQSNTIRSYVERVSKEIGQSFDLRDCRRTYGQILINKGADIETVSKMLGHKTTQMTEKCYCSLQQSNALEKAASVFANSKPVDFRGIGGGVSRMPVGFDMNFTSPCSTPVNGGDS